MDQAKKATNNPTEGALHIFHFFRLKKNEKKNTKKLFWYYKVIIQITTNIQTVFRVGECVGRSSISARSLCPFDHTNKLG